MGLLQSGIGPLPTTRIHEAMTISRIAQRSRFSGRLTVSSLLCLSLLLVLPSLALNRLTSSLDWRLLLGAPLAASVIAFLAYRSDKRRAEAGAWRIPESTLHILELIGGWPGAFLGQRTFRHKTAKISYQIVFWAIVLVYQLVAIDALVGWRFTSEVRHLIKL
ncbi:MAG: hypothetical protein JWM16_5027 [Verrucomicrobiales bacterium]|nr:hypothetical protein [Verrucomicrobiales bacterium]